MWTFQGAGMSSPSSCVSSSLKNLLRFWSHVFVTWYVWPHMETIPLPRAMSAAELEWVFLPFFHSCLGVCVLSISLPLHHRMLLFLIDCEILRLPNGDDFCDFINGFAYSNDLMTPDGFARALRLVRSWLGGSAFVCFLKQPDTQTLMMR